eukprot:scaffold184888_cov18-Prasinocladus_malaysianus.AAC.1
MPDFLIACAKILWQVLPPAAQRREGCFGGPSGHIRRYRGEDTALFESLADVPTLVVTKLDN